MDTRERLAALLKERGLSQRKLAERSGVSRSHLSAYLTGTREDMGFSLMAAVARALDVSLDWLAGLPPRHSDALQPDEEDLLRAWRAIEDERLRRWLLNAARDAAAPQE